MTTMQKLIDEARRHCTPMFVRLAQAMKAQHGSLAAGSVWPARRYDGVSQFVIIDTPLGTVEIDPRDFDVLVWRWYPPLPRENTT